MSYFLRKVRALLFCLVLFPVTLLAQITVPYFDIDIPICVEKRGSQIEEPKLFLSFTQFFEGSPQVISGHGTLGLTSQSFTVNQFSISPPPNTYSVFGRHPAQNKLYGFYWDALSNSNNQIRTFYSLDLNANNLTDLADVDLPAYNNLANPDPAGATVINNELWVQIANTPGKDDNDGQMYIFDLNNPTATPTLLQDNNNPASGYIFEDDAPGLGDIVVDPDTINNPTALVFFRFVGDTIYKFVYNRTTNTVVSKTLHYTFPEPSVDGALGLIEYPCGDKLYLLSRPNFDENSSMLIEVDKITGDGKELFTLNIPQVTTNTPLGSTWNDSSVSLSPVFE